MSSKRKLICGITMGDPAGVGPEVILKALNEKGIQRLADFLIIGNRRVFEKTAGLCKIRFKMDKVINAANITELAFGKSRASYGLAALKCIETALRLIKQKKIDALVTAPVNKHNINLSRKRGQATFIFRGHTEYLARATNTKDFAMMLVGRALKVVLATRHIALKDVARSLTKEKIYQTISLTEWALRKYFGISSPRIGVCSLNPHSGEGGILGEEEIKIIQPAIKRASRVARIIGPLPADTIFYLANQGKFDAVVAMYHDQGLIPLKTLAFHQGVNFTLGLPFVRTSPDHGTAYDIAGKNKANPGSMIEAIKLAVEIGYRIKPETSRLT